MAIRIISECRTTSKSSERIKRVGSEPDRGRSELDDDGSGAS